MLLYQKLKIIYIHILIKFTQNKHKLTVELWKGCQVTVKLLSTNTRKKIYCVFVFLLLSFTMYLVIKFVLPVIWPFLLAFFIAHYLNKCVAFLNKKLKINSKLATFFVLGVVFTLVVGTLVFLFAGIVTQVKVMAENFDSYVLYVDKGLRRVCNGLGETFGVDTYGFYDTIQDRAYEAAGQIESAFMENFMGNTKKIAENAMNFIILIVLLFTAIIYMTKDMEDIRQALRRSFFCEELLFVKRLLKNVFYAYVKTQLVLICVISVICVAGLLILKNPYSLGLGILIGVLDALPLFGVGVVLLPWTLFCLATGDYFYAAMLFTMFVLSYMAREYLEPKIMGSTIGLHPVMSLVAVYVGYTLFGFLGMLIGPFVFVMIFEIMKKVME